MDFESLSRLDKWLYESYIFLIRANGTRWNTPNDTIVIKILSNDSSSPNCYTVA